MSESLIANTRRYVYDTIDGETLLLDTQTGHLLLVGGFGSPLWQRLLNGAAVDALLTDIVGRFGPAAGETCQRFLQTLAEAEVVIPVTTAGAEPGFPDWPESFAEPVFERYDDISSMITIDPIHEVDENTGWPKPRFDDRE